IPGRAEVELAQDRADLGFIAQQLAHRAQMVSKLVGRRAVRRERRAKAVHGVRDHAADQRLFGWKVIVERRDVQADARRDLAGAQSLESALRDLVEGGPDEGLLAVFLV